jgi:hypothetical protein
MIKAVAVHCHGDTPNEINSSYLAEPRRLNDKLRACWQMITLLVDQAWTLRRGVVPIWDEEARRMLCGPVAGS